MNAFTFHIVVGLPGSGKSYFISKEASSQYVVDLDSYRHSGMSLEESLKDAFNKEKVMELPVYHNYDQNKHCYIDGLFVKTKTVQKIVDFCKDYFNKNNSGFESVKIILHVWNEDKEKCIYNDEIRIKFNERDKLSRIIINHNNIDDMSEIEGAQIENHEVEKISFKDKLLSYGVDGFLYSSSWSGGGSWCDCWGNSGTIHPESTPQFDEFDNLLTLICPNVTFLQYKNLYNESVEIEETREHDYYGGTETIFMYKCNLNSLYNKLVELNLIHEE